MNINVLNIATESNAKRWTMFVLSILKIKNRVSKMIYVCIADTCVLSS